MLFRPFHQVIQPAFCNIRMTADCAADMQQCAAATAVRFRVHGKLAETQRHILPFPADRKSFPRDDFPPRGKYDEPFRFDGMLQLPGLVRVQVTVGDEEDHVFKEIRVYCDPHDSPLYSGHGICVTRKVGYSKPTVISRASLSRRAQPAWLFHLPYPTVLDGTACLASPKVNRRFPAELPGNNHRGGALFYLQPQRTLGGI